MSARVFSCFLAAMSALLMFALPSQAQASGALELRSLGQTNERSAIYDKWLHEDVRYIITPEELQTFRRLHTDKDRDQFIEAFWEKRNPLPGTSHNRFKEEHYRRIAYANEHFATISFPGWRSDRGRIYVLYGRPDQIESHPSGGISERLTKEGDKVTSPFEVWLYRHIDGIGDNLTFKFVDQCRCGDYTLAPSHR